MLFLFLFAPLLSGGWCLFLTPATCPVPTPCHCTSSIHCDRHDLTVFPSIINSSQTFTVFDLSYNRIDYVPADAFKGVSVDTIDLSGNPLFLNMHDDALVGLENSLQQLTITHTMLSALPSSISRLRKLRRLNVAESNLHIIDVSSFDIPGYPLEYLDIHNANFTNWPAAVNHLNYLTSLDISGNQISVIPNNSFTSFSHSLSSLDISNCGFKEFPAEVNKLKHMYNLNIGDNKISDIPVTSFYYTFRRSLHVLNATNIGITDIPAGLKYARVLKTLYLSHNPIRDPKTSGVFTGLSHRLTTLYLDHCLLQSVPASIEHLLSLTYLDLSYNSIKVLENYAFTNQKALTTLNLDGNDLFNVKHLSLNGMDSLKNLRLHNCSLAFFPGSALMGNPGIELVDLSYNYITELEDASVPYLKNLKSLSLSGNKFVNMSSVSFSGLPSLDVLYLNNCGFDEVPTAVEFVTNARYIELHNNNIVCDCGLEWLWKWKVAHGLIPHIQGECLGNVTTGLDLYIRNGLKDCP